MPALSVGNQWSWRKKVEQKKGRELHRLLEGGEGGLYNFWGATKKFGKFPTIRAYNPKRERPRLKVEFGNHHKVIGEGLFQRKHQDTQL